MKNFNFTNILSHLNLLDLNEIKEKHSSAVIDAALVYDNLNNEIKRAQRKSFKKIRQVINDYAADEKLDIVMEECPESKSSTFLKLKRVNGFTVSLDQGIFEDNEIVAICNFLISGFIGKPKEDFKRYLDFLRENDSSTWGFLYQLHAEQGTDRDSVVFLDGQFRFSYELVARRKNYLQVVEFLSMLESLPREAIPISFSRGNPYIRPKPIKGLSDLLHVHYKF